MIELDRDTRDSDRLLKFLRKKGLKVLGIGTRPGKTYVNLDPSEGRDPKPFVDQYVDQDYYEFTAERKAAKAYPEGAVYEVKRDGQDILKLTVTKKNGTTGKLKPDTEEIDFHWHGTKAAYVSNMKIKIVNGVGRVDVGKIYVPGSAVFEAVHPEEKALRAVAFLEFVTL